MDENENLVGLSWFKPEQWSTLKKISSDYGGFKESYEEWERSALNHYKRLKELGLNTLRGNQT